MSENHEAFRHVAQLDGLRGHLSALGELVLHAPVPPKESDDNLPADNARYYENVAHLALHVGNELDELAQSWGRDGNSEAESEYYLASAVAAGIGALALQLTTPHCQVSRGTEMDPEPFRTSQYETHARMAFLSQLAVRTWGAGGETR